MRVFGIRCPACDDVIVSYYTHDFKYCKCGYCFIDGGREYQRVGWGVKPDKPRHELTREDWDRIGEQTKAIGSPPSIEVLLPDEEKKNARPDSFPY